MKKNRKNTIPEALIANRENEIKEEPIQKKWKYSVRDRKTEQQSKNREHSATHQTETLHTNARH